MKSKCFLIFGSLLVVLMTAKSLEAQTAPPVLKVTDIIKEDDYDTLNQLYRTVKHGEVRLGHLRLRFPDQVESVDKFISLFGDVSESPFPRDKKAFVEYLVGMNENKDAVKYAKAFDTLRKDIMSWHENPW